MPDGKKLTKEEKEIWRRIKEGISSTPTFNLYYAPYIPMFVGTVDQEYLMKVGKDNGA